MVSISCNHTKVVKVAIMAEIRPGIASEALSENPLDALFAYAPVLALLVLGHAADLFVADLDLCSSFFVSLLLMSTSDRTGGRRSRGQEFSVRGKKTPRSREARGG